MNLEVDTTITNFKLANSLDGLYLYLPNGLDDYEKAVNTSSFGILIKDSFDIDQTNRLLDFMIEDLEANKKYKYSEVENKNSFHNNGLYREVTIEERNFTNGDKLTARYYYAFAFKKIRLLSFYQLILTMAKIIRNSLKHSGNSKYDFCQHSHLCKPG